MDCREARNLIAALDSGPMGRLDPSLAEHLERCASCSRAWEAERNLDRLLVAGAPDAGLSGSLHGRVEDAIRAEAAGRSRSPLPRWAPVAGALVATGAVVAVTVGQFPSMFRGSPAATSDKPLEVAVAPEPERSAVPEAASAAPEKPTAAPAAEEREVPPPREERVATTHRARANARGSLAPKPSTRALATANGAIVADEPADAVAAFSEAVARAAPAEPAERPAPAAPMGVAEEREPVASPVWLDETSDMDSLRAVPVVGGEAVAALDDEPEEGAVYDFYAHDTEVAVVSFGDVVSAGWVSDVPAAALVEPAGAHLATGAGLAGGPAPRRADSSEVVIP